MFAEVITQGRGYKGQILFHRTVYIHNQTLRSHSLLAIRKNADLRLCALASLFRLEDYAHFLLRIQCARPSVTVTNDKNRHQKCVAVV